MRDPLFTLTMTCASRALILRAGLARLPRRRDPEAAARARCSAHTIQSGANRLDAVFCEPAHPLAQVPGQPCLLLCHGIGETVDRWRGVQELLAAEGVASLVFNYSGYGRSTGWIDADQLELDAICAFAYLRALRPQARISLLGFSLGSAIATAVVTKVAPHRLVLCSAFTSFRKAAASLGIPTWLGRLLPDRWDVEQALRSAAAPPLLILHGGADRLFPVRMARDLAAASVSSAELVLVPALEHNAPIDAPSREYWSRVASFVCPP